MKLPILIPAWVASYVYVVIALSVCSLIGTYTYYEL